MPRRFVVSLLLTLLSLSGFSLGCDRGSHPEHMGKPAPDFSVTDDSRSIHLADYRGKIVLVNFWATWCAPCIEELPSLQALQQQMPQVTVLAISVDEDLDAYQRFLRDHRLTLLTVNDSAQHANALFGTFRFPETYVVDRNGYIRRKFISSQDWTNPEIVNYLRHL